MKVSVVIPTYNEEKVISECIASLINQNFKDFEVIVVDDGSTDNTLKILDEFKVKILKQKHQGPAMARNLGAKEAKGKILVFVDADMTFDSKFLRNLVKPIEENKTKGTFSKDEYVANWENIWAKCWNINENLPEKRRLPFDYPDTQRVFRAVLKTEFDRVGGFSKGGYTDDYTLSEKLGYEAEVAQEAIFYHKNPATLAEVYKQAKWVGKREYKLGIIGYFVALVRASFPFSIVIALWKAQFNFWPLPREDYIRFHFLTFKLVYDFGIFTGILEMLFTGKTAK